MKTRSILQAVDICFICPLKNSLSGEQNDSDGKMGPPRGLTSCRDFRAGTNSVFYLDCANKYTLMPPTNYPHMYKTDGHPVLRETIQTVHICELNVKYNYLSTVRAIIPIYCNLNDISVIISIVSPLKLVLQIPLK